jgi:glycosyltransferase involved in cell wall biosynthesis
VIAIPTFNRAQQVHRAVAAALGQHCNDVSVVVVDDGSTDATRARLQPFFEDPRFTYVRLVRNVGTAKAKNVALATVPFDAITFHDSDDVPHPTKLLRQRQILELQTVEAHPCLNWRLAGKTAGQRLDVSVALTWHELITTRGQRHVVRRGLSLVDDFFPGLQMNAGPPGDWVLVNSGLFRREVFTRSGGFADCIEEDRELRNRLVMAGEVFWLIEDVLLTKVDSPDSLTVDTATGYASERRVRDRALVWERVERWLGDRQPQFEAIDLSGVEIAEVSRPRVLALAEDIPVRRPTAEPLLRSLAALGSVRPATADQGVLAAA